MKISVVTGVWKRPKVFEIFAKNIKKIPFKAEVIVVGSEGHLSRDMVKSHGFTYLERPNSPLGRKMNTTTEAARGSDYVVCMGSDDLISVDLWNRMYHLMQEGYDIIGLQDLYFYHLETKKAIYWGGYTDHRKGQTTGVGRCLSNRLMNKLAWNPWDSRIDRYLDGSMTKRISRTGVDVNTKTINLKEEGLLAVDIKSDVNVTPFKLWENTSYISSHELQSEFDI